MWLFRGGSTPPFGEDDESGLRLLPPEQLREEAVELRAKLEALRMADYREQLRASCVATAATAAEHAAAGKNHHGFTGGCTSPSPATVEKPGTGYGCDKVSLESSPLSTALTKVAAENTDDQVSLEDPGPVVFNMASTDSDDEGRHDLEVSPPKVSKPSVPDLASTRQAPSLPEEPAVGGLAAAAQALQTLRAQMVQLREELGKANGHLVTALFAGLDAAEVAVTQARMEADAEAKARTETAPEQHTEVVPPEAPDPLEGIDRAQVVELAQITEELTDALEISRQAEVQAQQELHGVRQRLAEEERRRVDCERRLAAQERRPEHEQAASDAARRNKNGSLELRALLSETEERLAASQAHAQHLQTRLARLEVEDGLARRLASKGRILRFKHLEI